MSSGAQELRFHLQQQRSTVMQGVLWALVAIGSASLVLDGLLEGGIAFTLTVLAPSALFWMAALAACWIYGRRRPGLAVRLAIALTLCSAALPVLVTGVASSVTSLLLFFLPLALASLLLRRSALYLVTGATLLTLLAATALQSLGLSAAEPAEAKAAWGTVLQFSLVYLAVATFLARFGSAAQAILHLATEQEMALETEARERRKTQESLIEGQSFNEALIESLPGIFYVIDESGRYVRWNRNLPRIFGYRDEEMPTIGPVDLADPRARASIAQGIREAFALGYQALEASFVSRSGERLPYFVTATRVTIAGDHFLTGVGIDRSEVDHAKARAEALNKELAERYERINALREVDTAISASLDLRHVLKVVLDQVIKRLTIDAAAILLYDHDNQSLNYHARRGFKTDALLAAQVRLGEGIAGRAGRDRRNLLVNDPTELARQAVHRAAVEAEGFHSSKAVPLIAKGQLKGVLQLFHRSPIELDADWREFLDALATQAAIALDNAQLLDSLARSNAELRKAYDTTIEGWARALDLKDEETAGHSQRVTALTLELAQRLAVPSHELEHIRRGALLHDIGKMGVPDSILLKPGKLDEGEWAVMQKHTTYARDLLAPIPFLRDALDIPYAHHEKYDGSGYPRGLAGDEIPLAARIFAVVDVYDALTSDRPYRRAWSQERALEHIHTQAGTHFDPTVVTAFLELMAAEGRERAAISARSPGQLPLPDSTGA